MKIVFDMDNTLVDELGQKVRPEIKKLLKNLSNDGHELALWTNSTRQRANIILKDHSLNEFFSQFIFRENYDPDNEGKVKDIRTINGDILIDDDPKHVNFANQTGKLGIQIFSYRGSWLLPHKELEKIRRQINRRGGISGFLKRMLS